MMRQKDLAAVRKLREQKLQEEEERQVRAGRLDMVCLRESFALVILFGKCFARLFRGLRIVFATPPA